MRGTQKKLDKTVEILSSLPSPFFHICNGISLTNCLSLRGVDTESKLQSLEINT